jgi:hypothetical protein
VDVQWWFNGTPRGLQAGIRVASGQGGIAVQSTALIEVDAFAGQTVQLRAAATNAGAKIVSAISGVVITQIRQYPTL